MNGYKTTRYMVRMSFLSIGFLLLTYSVGAQDFVVEHDTFRLDSKAYAEPFSRWTMKRAVKYHDRYFLAFENRPLYFDFWNNVNRLLSISLNDNTVEDVGYPVPRGYNDDIFVRHDTLFISAYLRDNDFFYDEKSRTWKERGKLSDLLYEDEEFEVYKYDMGEWGCYTWFVDRKTREQFLFFTGVTRINRVNGIFYLTGSDVRILENPRTGILCTPPISYSADIRERDQDFLMALSAWAKNNRELSEDFKDPIRDCFAFQWDTVGYDLFGFDMSKDTFIHTAFQVDGQLYLVVSAPQNSFIARLHANRLDLVLDFHEKYDFFQHSNGFRGINVAENRCLMPFTRAVNECGFVEIEGRHLRIAHIFCNQDSLPYVGRDGFEETFAFLDQHLDSLHFRDVLEFENSLGLPSAVADMSGRNRYLGDTCDNPEKCTWKEFVRVVDSALAFHIWYCFSNQDSIVQGVYIEWDDAESFTPIDDRKSRCLYRLSKERYRQISEALLPFFNRKMGGKYVKDKEKYVWETSSRYLMMQEPKGDLRILFYPK